MVEPREIFDSLMAADRAIVRLVGPTAACLGTVRAYCLRAKVPLLEINFTGAPSDASVNGFTSDNTLRALDKLSPHFKRLSRAYLCIAERTRVDPHAPYGMGPPSMLRVLEYAAGKVGARPVVHFVRADRLIRAGAHGFSMTWGLRNEVQHHHHCRYVFSGTLRSYSPLDAGQRAPLLHLGGRINLAKTRDYHRLGGWGRNPPPDSPDTEVPGVALGRTDRSQCDRGDRG